MVYKLFLFLYQLKYNFIFYDKKRFETLHTIIIVLLFVEAIDILKTLTSCENVL